MNEEPNTIASGTEKQSYFARVTKAQWSLVGLALIMAAGMIAYHVVVAGDFKTTALMFVGIPALLAILFTLLPRPKSPIWMAMKGTTIALCLSSIVLGEGIPCVVMAAPIFYLAAAIVAAIFERARKSANQNTVRALVFLPLALLSLEGTHELLTFERMQSAAVEKEIALKPEVFEQRLARSFAFRAEQPLFLRLFTRPVDMTGSGLTIGAERRITFSGPGSHGGALRLRVVERKPGTVKFRMISDTTKIASWMGWRTARVEWQPAASGKLRVRWSFEYERRLDPAWYFGPLQAYAVELGGSFLTDNLAH